VTVHRLSRTDARRVAVRAQLVAAVEQRTLLELDARVRPSEDLALYRADMAAWPGTGALRDWQEGRRDWVVANDACRRDILARLEASGPLTMRDLPDSCAVPWASTGWTNNRNVEKLLDLMVARGEVATAGRHGPCTRPEVPGRAGRRRRGRGARRRRGRQGQLAGRPLLAGP
jgi:uncharacterized protein YcaQ